MKEYLVTSLVNKLHFYALFILLIALSFANIFYVIGLVLYLIYLIIHRFLNKEMILLGCIFILIFCFRYTRSSSIDTASETIELSVVESEEKDTYTKYRCKYKNEFLIVYDYSSETYIPGDVVEFRGTINKINNFSDFDYVSYMKSSRTYVTIKSSGSNKISHKNNFSFYKYKIRSFYKDKFDELTYTYFDSLVFGTSISDDNLSDNISKMQISYLFAISGFHISLIAFILDKILSLIIKDETKRDIALVSTIFLYSSLCNFQVGVMRAFLALLLKKINRYKSLSFTNLDIFSLSFLILIFINPLYIFKTGFKYSFIASLFIILGNTLINTKNKVINAYLLTILCFISTMPLTINLNNEINLLAIVLGPIYVFLFSYIIMPIIYLLLLIPFISSNLLIVFDIFSNFISYFASFDSFIIRVKSLNAIEIIIYYVLFFLVLVGLETLKHKKEYIIIFGTYLFVIFFININTLTTVEMINVGQGDSFLIRDKDKTMCVDSYSTNISYIKSKGIKTIDILLITHSDNDHIGSALEMCTKFDVKKVIFNKYEESEISREITKLVEDVSYLGAGETFYFNNHIAHVLGPCENIDTNNNSLVFDITLNNVSFLFTGDSEASEENLIYTKYYKYDFVKIAHHGSKSSTSDTFLNHVSFDNALISVGINNIYNHPSSETILKLKDKNVYLTSTSNSVVIYLFNNKYVVYPTIKKRYLLNKLDLIKFN